MFHYREALKRPAQYLNLFPAPGTFELRSNTYFQQRVDVVRSYDRFFHESLGLRRELEFPLVWDSAKGTGFFARFKIPYIAYGLMGMSN